MIVPRDITVPAAFLAGDTDSSPISPCIVEVHDVHALAAGFPNFKINACVGVDRQRGDPVQVVLDTAARPNLVREDFLPRGWEQHRRPLSVKFTIVDASRRRIPPQAVVPLFERMGKTLMRKTFCVVKRLAVPVLLGCAFIRQHVRAIFPGDDKVVVTSEESISFAWLESKRRPQWSGHGRPPKPHRARQRKRKRLDRIKVARARIIPPGERAAIWVSAPVKGTYLIIPRADLLQRKGLALANGVAEIEPARAFRVYVSKFSHTPIRLVKGINLGTLKPISPTPMGCENAEGSQTLLVDEDIPLEEGEGIRNSPPWTEVLGEVADEREIFESWEAQIARCLDGLENQIFRGKAL